MKNTAKATELVQKHAKMHASDTTSEVGLHDLSYAVMESHRLMGKSLLSDDLHHNFQAVLGVDTPKDSVYKLKTSIPFDKAVEVVEHALAKRPWEEHGQDLRDTRRVQRRRHDDG